VNLNLRVFFRLLLQTCVKGVGLSALLLASTLAVAQAGGHKADYQRAVYDPIHFKPAIEKATNAQCLACHAEVLKPSVREQSPAGLKAANAKAWYQQTSVYSGEQDTFHRRHLETPLAKELMQLRCTTCHQGHDPRDENPGSSATSQRLGAFTLRKVVVPEQTCLKCHGQMNYAIMGLPQPWPQSKEMFQNNCLLCHAAIRTTRHQVNYLNAAAIEESGKKSTDSCYGCHGGRAWYRISYPYARSAWPGMAADVPDWAKARPKQSEARFLEGMPKTGGTQ
jgi:nitrate/TMAO reductase-like tetraheme cytochrome c subunit